jgi:hypothetical protein
LKTFRSKSRIYNPLLSKSHLLRVQKTIERETHLIKINRVYKSKKRR